MKRLFVFALGFFALAGASIAASETSYPMDEAALYQGAKKEGAVVWYSSADLAVSNAVAGEFMKRYPGVEVKIVRLPGVQEYQRFMEETAAGQHIVDIVNIADQPSMAALVADGHLVKWPVPTKDRYPEAYRINDAAYAPQKTDVVMVYNSKLSDEEVAMLEKSWTAILDPRFKGRFAVQTQNCGTCYAPISMFLDPAMSKIFPPDFIKKVAAQKPVVYNDYMVAMDRVIAGEQDFTFGTPASAALTKWMQGAPIRWLHPNPTPSYPNNFYAVSSYAPHPYGARLFLTWLLSEEGAKVLIARFGADSAMSGVPDGRPTTKEPWFHPIVERYIPDFKQWSKNYDKDMRIWMTTMRSGS